MSEDVIKSLVSRSRKAQEEYDSFSQERVDAIVRDIAKVIFDNAEPLAALAVEETRMGVYEDKVKKNRGKASIIWSSLKGKKSVGLLSCNPDTGVAEIARPVGVVGAVTPCTNPIVTPMCNAMFALKGRNSIIIAPHPRAKKCAKRVTDLFAGVLSEHKAPRDLILIVEEPSVELTSLLMKHVDVVVATGGMGMVKSAYSSGKPAFGVGAGNVQCIIDRNVSLKDAIPKIVTGRIFDNGIICSSEQTVMVHEDDYANVVEEFKANGALYIDDRRRLDILRKALYPDGVMNKDLVGQSVKKIGELSGLSIPEGTRLILVKADGSGTQDFFCKEKMCPVLAILPYKTFEEAVAIAQENLNVEGRGHSASIHSDDRRHIEYAAERLTVSRVLVNQICATMNGGSYHNGFSPTTTLGCGSWGNNSISENFTYKHLLNISRIGYFMKEAKVPTEQELWG